jgi:predicted TIM-barrel fold metal-dependent hydrolase
MQTPWGEIEVADAHVHFFSDNFFQLLARQKEGLTVEGMGPLLGWEMPPSDPAALATRWVEELDRHHVSRAALIASLPGDEASVEAAVSAYPDRFYGYFIVNPLAPEIAPRVGQMLAGRRLRVACLFPSMHRYSLHDPSVAVLLDAVAETPAPVVFVHCGVLSVGIRKKLGLASPFDLRFSNPVDLHALALRYPQVRFIIPHFGAGYFREALMVASLCRTSTWIHPAAIAGCSLSRG